MVRGTLPTITPACNPPEGNGESPIARRIDGAGSLQERISAYAEIIIPNTQSIEKRTFHAIPSFFSVRIFVSLFSLWLRTHRRIQDLKQ
jgi:hypothetical protein